MNSFQIDGPKIYFVDKKSIFYFPGLKINTFHIFTVIYFQLIVFLNVTGRERLEVPSFIGLGKIALKKDESFRAFIWFDFKLIFVFKKKKSTAGCIPDELPKHWRSSPAIIIG